MFRFLVFMCFGLLPNLLFLFIQLIIIVAQFILPALSRSRLATKVLLSILSFNSQIISLRMATPEEERQRSRTSKRFGAALGASPPLNAVQVSLRLLSRLWLSSKRPLHNKRLNWQRSTRPYRLLQLGLLVTSHFTTTVLISYHTWYCLYW